MLFADFIAICASCNYFGIEHFYRTITNDYSADVKNIKLKTAGFLVFINFYTFGVLVVSDVSVLGFSLN